MANTNIEMDKSFNIEAIEQKWYEQWIKDDIFTAGHKDRINKQPYVIMMPPPNVTGALHNGHALFVTLQDILCRFWRMKGRDVLWLPGTDHAGIATQTVVERELNKKEGKSRHDLGRKDFLKRVFLWKDKHGDRIIEQLKLMGASADWSRLRFTMDEQCSKAVSTAFVQLWNEGLIYRKERLVSWDIKTKTALSNEEVDHIEKEGELSYFAYKLKNHPELEIVVATTRPETMLGDVAVAVNPKDERYNKLIGKELEHPFIKDRSMHIIGDEYVDPEFGSGAVKITPAHDPNDFEMAKRHNLPMINIFSLDGFINEKGGIFSGLERMIARKEVVKELKNLGLFKKSEKIQHAVAISQRSGVDIEPMLSRQYFVDTKPLAKMAYDAVEQGETKIIPASFKKTWDHFLLNIEDWCISRQLWWGHRIPVYYHINDLHSAILKAAGKNHLACFKALKDKAHNELILRLALDELDEQSIRSFSHAFIETPKDMENYLQEEDVLDTWFSSGLWPFSTLGWPQNTADLERYYPGDVLETGFDILFFWVARMMMFGIYFMGKAPFKDVYLHSMVRDAQGRKMSKSLGNAIDPIDVIKGISLNDLIEKTKSYPVPESELPRVLGSLEKDYPEGIPSAGADGLRFSLAVFSGQGQNVKFSIPRVMGYRAFLNKLWNATRFSLMHINEGDQILELSKIVDKLSLADRYILSHLNQTIAKVNQYLTQYRFSDAAETIYQFFWNEYCDKYIECAKVSFKSDTNEQQQLTKSVLIHLLDSSMRIIHPFCPFISEEIWQHLPSLKKYQQQGTKFCAIAPFPEEDPSLINEQAELSLGLIFEVGAMVRNARQSSALAANLAVPVELFAKDQKTKEILVKYQQVLIHLAKISSLEIFLRGEKEVTELNVTNSSASIDTVILLKGLIDVDKEIERLDHLLLKITKQKVGLEQRLSSSSFVKNAPKEIVDAHQQELADLNEKYEQLLLAKTRLS